MAGPTLDPGSAAQREAFVDGAREDALKQPAARQTGPTGNVTDDLARAIATQWAGGGAETAGVRDVVQKFVASVLRFRPASQMAQGWAPLVRTFQPPGPDRGGASELALTRTAAFILSLLPPRSRSLASLLDEVSPPKQEPEEPAVPQAAPAEPEKPTGQPAATEPEKPTDQPAATEPEKPTDQPAATEPEKPTVQRVPSPADAEKAFNADAEKAFMEVAEVATQMLSVGPQATGRFPPFKEAIEKALRKLGRKLGRGVADVTSIIDFYETLLGKWFLSENECELIATTIGSVFKSSPDLGGKIEAALRDSAVSGLFGRGIQDYVVHQDSVYYASPFPTPRRLSAEASLRGSSMGDVSLNTLITSRTSQKAYYIRRRGSGSSREDLVVFTGRKPTSGTLLKPLFDDNNPFPEFYEIKPVGSLYGAADQAFAYVHNYLVARIFDSTNKWPWSATPVIADPRTNTLGLPSLTLVSAGKLVAPGKRSEVFKALKDWVKVAPPFVIIPFMLDGAWGVVPYVAVDIGNAIATAVIAVAIKTMLDEIDQLAKKLKRAIDEIAPVIEAIVNFLILIVLEFMIVAASFALAIAAAAEAPLLLAFLLGAALVIIITAGPAGPDTQPEDAPMVFYLGGLVINASPRAFANILRQAMHLTNGFFSQSSTVSAPNL
jgi:hypothetical protein